MIIDCVSDLHGYQPELEGGDLLIVAGDLTASDKFGQHSDFKKWLYEQNYAKKIVIAGNHDGHFIGLPPGLYIFSSYNTITHEQLSYADYLMDSATEFNGLKIWGSPWTPTFMDWYFMKDRGKPIKKMWDLIPDDVDILVTHGPPYGIQDQVEGPEKFAGCEELRNALDRLKKLKLHVFGHVHEGYGKVEVNGVIHVNASIMNQDYQPVNKPIRVML